MRNLTSFAAAMATLSVDKGFDSGLVNCSKMPPQNLDHFESKKPLTKRQKRRLRGKGDEG